MSFKIIKHNEEGREESDKVRGNAVIGRYGRECDYDDRTIAGDLVEVDDYAAVPGEYRNNHLSRNHLLVMENMDWEEYMKLAPVFDRKGNSDVYDLWDLNGTGTEYIGENPDTAHEMYKLGGDVAVEIKPCNHYIGVAGEDSDPFRGWVRYLGEDFEERGFDVSTMIEPGWDEVTDMLSEHDRGMDSESTTVIFYSGHGSPRGISLKGSDYPAPREVLEEVSKLEGKKMMVVDSCYSGRFAKALETTIAPETAVITASGPDEKKNLNEFSGDFIEEIREENGELDLKAISEVKSVFSNRNIQIKGSGFTGLSRKK